MSKGSACLCTCEFCEMELTCDLVFLWELLHIEKNNLLMHKQCHTVKQHSLGMQREAPRQPLSHCELTRKLPTKTDNLLKEYYR